MEIITRIKRFFGVKSNKESYKTQKKIEQIKSSK